MNSATVPIRCLRRACLIVATTLLLGTELTLPSPVQAQVSAPSSPSVSTSGPLVAQARPKGPPRRPGDQGMSGVTIVLIVVGVVAVLGGLVFLVMKLQGGADKKPKVSESAEAIGGYRIDKMLQQGAVSQVHEVAEIVSGRHFAMKMLLPEAANNPVQRQLLFNEADVGIEMAHPNVIKIIKVFKESKTPCFVMEFFPSGSVRQRLMYKDWDFIREQAHNILKQAATGLAYMNSNGWLHRDIKPDNILVNSAGEVRLIDFAIAQRIPTGLAKWFRKKGARAGTRSYMSPEAIRCWALDTRSDIYSFGATCYEIVTFRTPFKAGSSDDLLNKHLFEKPVAPQAYCPDLTDEFNALVLRMLAKKREERPQNFHEVLMELRKVKIFKKINAAPPKDGGPLQLHPEALSAMRRTGAPAPPPRPPGGEAKPKG